MSRIKIAQTTGKFTIVYFLMAKGETKLSLGEYLHSSYSQIQRAKCLQRFEVLKCCRMVSIVFMIYEV